MNFGTPQTRHEQPQVIPASLIDDGDGGVSLRYKPSDLADRANGSPHQRFTFAIRDCPSALTEFFNFLILLNFAASIFLGDSIIATFPFSYLICAAVPFVLAVLQIWSLLFGSYRVRSLVAGMSTAAWAILWANLMSTDGVIFRTRVGIVIIAALTFRNYVFLDAQAKRNKSLNE